MSSALVTGAAGFAGRHLVSHLLEFEPSVVAWSNPGGARPGQRDARVTWQAVDLLDRRAVEDAIAELQPAVIYHCGGVADVGVAWQQPERALRVNAIGTHHVLSAVDRARLECPVLVTGSALIYRQSSYALSEDAPIGPSSPYAVSKLAQELLTLQSTVAAPFMVRPFNHAGPGQSPAFVNSAFAKQVAEIEAGLAPPVLRVGNLDAKRDLTDVRDVVRAYRQIVHKGRPRRAYNVCSGRAYRIGDLLETLLGLSRVQVAIEFDPAKARPSDNPIVLGDRTRVGDEVGWSPAIPIERTLEDLLNDWRQQLAPRSP